MKRVKKIFITILILIIFTIICGYLELAFIYWKHNRKQEIFSTKIENLDFREKINLSPVDQIHGTFQGELFTASFCYGIRYDEDKEDVFLSKALWHFCGFSCIVFYYKIDNPAMCRKIKKILRENKTK